MQVSTLRHELSAAPKAANTYNITDYTTNNNNNDNDSDNNNDSNTHNNNHNNNHNTQSTHHIAMTILTIFIILQYD